MNLVAPKTSLKHGSESAERILAAAEDLFSEHGYDAVSMSDIALRAGVCKSSVFHHFSSKDALYFAVLNDARQAFFELIDKLHDGEGTIAERLSKFAALHLHRIIELGKISRLVLRDLLENSPGHGKQLAENVFNKNFSLLVDTMRVSQQRGEIRPDVDPAMAAIVLISADVFFFQASSALRHLPDIDFANDGTRFSTMLVDILLYGILPRIPTDPHHDKNIFKR